MRKGLLGINLNCTWHAKSLLPLEWMLINTKHVYFIRAEPTFLHPCPCLHFLEFLVAKHGKSLE